MTSKNVANIGSVVTDKTIDSQSLLAMVNDVYGKAAVDFLGQWMDWEQCYNALKMDWDTVGR